MGSRSGSIVRQISVFSSCNSCGCFHLTARLVTHTRTMSARVSAFSAAELRSAAEATTRYGRAGVDDSDTERASVSPRCDENADDVGTRPHPLFGLTRAERAYFDASGSPMRSNATNYGSIAVDVADTNEDEEEETGEGREERSSGWLAGIGHSRRGRGRVTVAAVACLAMCGVGAMALALAPPEVRASVASSLGLRIPTSPKPGFVEAKADLSPLGEQQQRPGPDRSKPVTTPRDAHAPKHPPTNTFEPRRNGYLVGLTTSAGFGDQFKRLSTYASMARELDRTLVLWPVWTSPHYDLGRAATAARSLETCDNPTGRPRTETPTPKYLRTPAQRLPRGPHHQRRLRGPVQAAQHLRVHGPRARSHAGALAGVDVAALRPRAGLRARPAPFLRLRPGVRR